MEATTTRLPLSEDAALVTALATTAMPFSGCAEEEAERWLRALRLHGRVGRVLQAVGVGEAPLDADTAEPCEQPPVTPPLGEAALERAIVGAERRADARGAGAVGTVELLGAVLEVYSEPMDRALSVRGASRDEVLERLAELRGDELND